MTDHPSTPPSQQWLIDNAMFAITVAKSPLQETPAILERLLVAALAAQEARHQAELRKVENAGSMLLEGAGVKLREAESKLREERDRCLGIVHSYGVGYPLGDIAAAIRSGQAQQAAPRSLFGWVGRRIGDHVQTVDCDATCLDCQDGGFGSDGIVKNSPPPEQETPKPEEACVHGIYPAWKCGNCGIGLGVPDPPKLRGLMSLRGIAPDITGDLSSEEYLKFNWAGEIVYCACGRPTAGPAQCSKCAPAAHGGQE